MAKGVDIEIARLDEDQVRAKITWSEQDVGGGKLFLEVTVKNIKTHPKNDVQLRSDVRALAVRFADEYECHDLDRSTFRCNSRLHSN